MTELHTLSPAELFDFLWRTKYAPKIEEDMALEAQRRSEAFLDCITLTVCGEELRMMTPRDLLMLDGFESPFVGAKRVPIAEDVAFFVWTLSARNSGQGVANAFRRGRCYGRIVTGSRDLALDVAEIEEYCAKMFLELDGVEADEKRDGPPQLERKPPSVYFMAPLLVNVAMDIGAVDPMSGRLLADTPIPRLLQYGKSIRKQKGGKDEDEISKFDVMRSQCLEEMNAIRAKGAA